MTGKRNIEDLLAEVAEQAEQTRDTFTKMHRSEVPPTDPSQVYSIRIPVSRLDRIRQLAAQYGMPPTAMLRHWILERLDQEEDLDSIPAAVAAEITHPNSSVAEKVFLSFYYSSHRALDVMERELRMYDIHDQMAGT